jgi:signal peptidase II
LRLCLLVAAFVLLADQLSKAWALNSLPGKPRLLPGGFLSLQLTSNPGAAFSIGASSTWFFTVVAVLGSAVLVWAAGWLSRPWPGVAFGLALGGALGNLVDRLIRAPGFGRGHVVDFIGYSDWFIGNLADIAIALAAVVLLFKALRTPSLTESSPQAGSTQANVDRPADPSASSTDTPADD